MTTLNLREETTLPADPFAGALAGRVWRPDVNGPSVVAVRDNGVFDISTTFPTMRDLCEAYDGQNLTVTLTDLPYRVENIT